MRFKSFLSLSIKYVRAKFESARSVPNHMSHVTSKPVFRVSDQARNKTSCRAKEDGLRLEFGVIGNRGIYNLCSKNKNSYLHTAQLIYAFVFSFAKSRFSDDTVYITRIQVTFGQFKH